MNKLNLKTMNTLMKFNSLMKNVSCLLLTLFLTDFISAQELKVISNTEIKEVKLYQNGAMLNRTAKVSLNPGNYELVFDGLSPYINPQSINVKGMGDAVMLNVAFKQNYLKDKIKSKEVVELEVLLDSLNYKYQQTLNTTTVLQEQQNVLLANKSIGGANVGVTAAQLQAMIDYFSRKLAEVKDKLLDNSIKEKKQKEQIEKLKNQLAELNNRKNQPSGSIVVNVAVKTKTNASFDLSYLIASNATWYPFYDIRAKDINSPVELIYKAKASQNTGEDWKNVKLVLSTGNPQEGGVKPELTTWFLNFYEPRPVYMLQKANRPSAAESREVPSTSPGFNEDAKQMESIPVQLNQNQLSSDFAIGIPYSILSDGEEYQVDIQSFQLPASYSYEATPKMDGDAFLTARLTGWENLSLTPGSANIYFDGAYIGESYINPGETEDTLTLSLGRDKRINIKREKLKEFSSTKLFGAYKERSFMYEITIRNTKNTSAEILLQDQIPVTQNKEIEIKVDELKGGDHNIENGTVKWKLKLQPNESKKLRLGFTVKYPKGKQIAGL